jgi:hypothetical protein
VSLVVDALYDLLMVDADASSFDDLSLEFKEVVVLKLLFDLILAHLLLIEHLLYLYFPLLVPAPVSILPEVLLHILII